MQTHSSEAIALNNQGQILGWYNIDGSEKGKHFFLRDQDGTFHEIPGKHGGIVVDWQYLADNGKTYGTSNVTIPGPGGARFLSWDCQNNLVTSSNLPSGEISAINDSGQVLIKSIFKHRDRTLISNPAIVENGNITELKGLEGELGIESDESCGFDMNNKGEVVGQSVASFVYKNNIYHQVHAMKWVNGQPIDLHKTIPKTGESHAFALNDSGEFLIQGDTVGRYFSRKDGSVISANVISNQKLLNSGKFYNENSIYETNPEKTIELVTSVESLQNICFGSTWKKIVKIIEVNDNGEIIAEGETDYGEKHALFLRPVGSD